MRQWLVVSQMGTQDHKDKFSCGQCDYAFWKITNVSSIRSYTPVSVAGVQLYYDVECKTPVEITDTVLGGSRCEPINGTSQDKCKNTMKNNYKCNDTSNYNCSTNWSSSFVKTAGHLAYIFRVEAANWKAGSGKKRIMCAKENHSYMKNYCGMGYGYGTHCSYKSNLALYASNDGVTWTKMGRSKDSAPTTVINSYCK